MGDPGRVGVITELRHDYGTPPDIVRWLDNGREALAFPGPDACVEAPRDDQPPMPLADTDW